MLDRDILVVHLLRLSFSAIEDSLKVSRQIQALARNSRNLCKSLYRSLRLCDKRMIVYTHLLYKARDKSVIL